jgi:glycerol-3-phosphate dehydrogenase
VAARVVDRVARRLAPRRFGGCRTATTPLGGGRPVPDEEGAAWGSRAAALGLDAAQIGALSRMYGARFGAFLNLAALRGAAERLHPELPWIAAQVDFAIEQELARTVEDVLRRRLPVALGPYRRDPVITRKVAERMGTLLGWDQAAREGFVERYLAA